MTAPAITEALATARYLAECGVPIFVAKLTASGGISTRWGEAQADPNVVDDWKPGWALCAVMGHLVDAIDIDPRNGGSLEALKAALGGELPRIYGVAKTPSGGEHYLIASLGMRKVGNIVPGVDIQAGDPDGQGRGILFIAPTVRTNKQTGKPGGYVWELEPDLDELLLVGGDTSGAKLAELMAERQRKTRGTYNAEGDYEGPSYGELDDAQKAEADEYCAGQLKYWRELFAEAVTWPDKHYPEEYGSRGWEVLDRDLAWALAKLAANPWVALDETGAELQYHEILPDEIAQAQGCGNKWLPDIVERAASDQVDMPPWVVRGSALDDFGRVRPICDVTNEGQAGRWLDSEMGHGPLSGLFRRKNDLIYTPRVGEEGYIPPENPHDHDGPAQVKRMLPLQLAKRIDKSYRVVKTVGGARNPRQVETIFPKDVADRSMSLLDEVRGLRDLRMVTHTPVVRADGSVLDQPGFDEASGVLYLPERGLEVAPVPEVPSDAEVEAARELLLRMIADFPFVSDHDRANYLGCLFVPLIRILVPPPYKMLIIGAPQRGSGKSLLALLMRTIHGGVFRSEIPSEEDERRKVITSVLDTTSAPVVQFDNVSGVLKSSVFDGLLTSAVWTDRRLGVQVNIELPNDRLWVATGNNVHIGGDLERRVLWCTINAHMERPEERPPDAFRISNLEDWVRANRGELIHAMLVLVRAWAAAGMPTEEAPTSDSFGRLTAVMRGVLEVAGIEGIVGHTESAPKHVDPDAEEFSAFLEGVRRVMGDDEWTVRELLEKTSDFDDEDGLRTEELPADIAARLRSQPGVAYKSLGRWLSYRTDRVTGGLVLTKNGSKKAALKWRVTEN